MASSSNSSFSSDPGSSQSYRYDVFLSFRGDDTRMRFVDHLYTALENRLIITFKDDKRLDPGEPIGPSLFTAIEESRIAVVVFSENYADSSWCLQELEYIMKCKEERGLIVMPIFYDVEPTDVRKQKRKFGEAFARYENEDTNKVESWKKTLADVCNNVGFDSSNRHEAEFIKEIVNKIWERLSSLNSLVDEDLVGMAGRLQELESLLEIGSDGVRMVGIWGVGGGGKTTLATSVHMKISHHFQGNCILENIREKSSKAYDGLQKLQESILSALLKTKEEVHSVTEGKQKIKSLLCRRKVLVVLDDVDKREQLEALAGSHKWFGSGTRIIITTRDEHLLKAHKVDKICPLTLLSHEEAKELFDKHACNKNEPIKGYEGLSLRVVSYAAGLPLAVKVLGSFLCDKNENEWMSALDRLKSIPEIEIVDKLKISYDGLKTVEKELFLDIACCFRWMNLNEPDDGFYKPREILEACGLHPDIGIKVLRQKALINIDVEGMIEMHDLVQEMAHYIVRRDHPNNPEYHSRLWKEEEIMNLRLWDATEKNDKIESLGFHCADDDDHASRFCKNVSNMKNLRWLAVEFSSFNAGDGGPTFLANELRYIKWFSYPGISFPDNFQATKLVVLKLEGSSQMVLWKSDKIYHCMSLVGLPELPSSLALLDAPWCESLTETLTNCKCLLEVSISPGSIINHGNKVLEYMLQEKAIENGTLVFTLKGGRQLAKGITPGLLRKGNKCRLQLPENWRNEFCGILMCAVGKRSFEIQQQQYPIPSWWKRSFEMVKINAEEVKSDSMDCEDEVDRWEESDGDDDDEVNCEDDDIVKTWVGYISFLRLRDAPWWDQTYNQLSFLIDDSDSDECSGFGVKLVGKTSESESESGGGPTNFSQFSDYALMISHSSPDCSEISIPFYDFHGWRNIQ